MQVEVDELNAPLQLQTLHMGGNRRQRRQEFQRIFSKFNIEICANWQTEYSL